MTVGCSKKKKKKHLPDQLAALMKTILQRDVVPWLAGYMVPPTGENDAYT